MTIRRIHIASFGPLTDFDAELYSGMNVIRGENESGKTSLAMFIKFIFYGLSGRSYDDAPSERKKYVNWDTGAAEGYIIALQNGREYRIERSLTVSVKAGSDKENVRETVTVTDQETGGRVPELEECPGAALFGVPEQVFVNTVFSGQSGRSRIDGMDTAAAVENLMFSADETVNVKKAAGRLEKYRRVLMHKKGSGGEIPALREKCSQLKERLESASIHASEIIDLENAAAGYERAENELVAAIERDSAALKYFDAEKLSREGDEAKRADEEAAAAESELRTALSLCCEASKLEEGRRLAAAIESERAGSSEFEERLGELEAGAASLENPDLPAAPEEMLEEYKKQSSIAGATTTFAVIAVVLAIVAGAAAAALYAVKNQTFLAVLAGAAVLFVVSGVLFILRGRRVSRMRDICSAFGTEDEDGLSAAVEYELSRRSEAKTISRRADSIRMSLEQSVERLELLETEAKALAASFEDCCKAQGASVDEDDPLARLRGAIVIAERRQTEAEARRGAFEAAKAVAAAKWDRISKDKLASAEEYIRKAVRDDNCPLNEAEADAVRRELSFNQAKLDALRKKSRSADVELAAKRAVAESPAELWEELSESGERLRLITLRHDAAVLAAQTLAKAGENMRRGIIPKIVKRASALFSSATVGRYESLGSSSVFQLSAVIDGRTRDAKALSAGTEDLAYVCLRLALAAELFGDMRPPLVFDESLAFMDPERSAAAADAMAVSGFQVLLFTCRPDGAPDPTLKLARRDF